MIVPPFLRFIARLIAAPNPRSLILIKMHNPPRELLIDYDKINKCNRVHLLVNKILWKHCRYIYVSDYPVLRGCRQCNWANGVPICPSPLQHEKMVC